RASSFSGGRYWQWLARCGGFLLKLISFYSGSPIEAELVRPDPAVNAQFLKKSDGARRTATVFFKAAEGYLMADRGVTRDDAMMTYDSRAAAEGDRHKTIETAEQATKPCPALYQSCREASTQISAEPSVSASVPPGSSTSN